MKRRAGGPPADHGYDQPIGPAKKPKRDGRLQFLKARIEVAKEDLEAVKVACAVAVATWEWAVMDHHGPCPV